MVKQKVLLTRSYDQGVATLHCLESLNISADLHSLSFVTYPYKNLPNIDFSEYKQIIVSSQNALLALTEKQKQQIKDKSILSVTKYLKGFSNVLYFTTMADLLNYIKGLNDYSAKIYLKGNYSSLTKPESNLLKSYNCVLKNSYRVCYSDQEFAKIADGLRQNSYSAILFFSKKSAKYFLSLVIEWQLESCLLNIKLCCISQGVARVFKAIRCNNIIIAQQPNLSNLVKCLDYPSVK